MLPPGGARDGRAQSTSFTWDFEAGASGWQVDAGTIAAGGTPRSGTSALIFDPGQIPTGRVRTPLGALPASPGAILEAGAWVRSSGGILRVSLEPLIHDAQGQLVATGISEDVLPGATYNYVTARVTDTLFRARYAQIRIFVEVQSTDATLEIDDVALAQVGTAATSTATATTTATGTSTSTGTSTATGTATGTTTATATVSPTSTRTAMPVPTPSVFGALTNGDFEHATPLYGWAHQGGDACLSDGYVSVDHVGLLHSTSSSTKWLHQAVLVDAGGWYEASAMLGTQSAADRAWLRLARYASLDGSGSQLSVDDSDEIGGAAGAVAVGPVQAPPNAQSVRVRLMLRPGSEAFAMLAADCVTLARTAPPTPTRTPTPTATSTRTPTLVPTPRVSSTPAGPIAGAALLPTVEAAVGVPPVAGPPLAAFASKPAAPRAIGRARTLLTDLEATEWIRISEVFPNPPQEGVDAAFE